MLTACITVGSDANHLEKLFLMEDKSFSNGRAIYEVKRNGQKLEFHIQAKDAIALKNVINTITKIIHIYEKVGEVLQNDGHQSE